MKKLLLSLILLLLIPLWCFADTPAIYQTPKGLKDSTVEINIPAKYFYRVSTHDVLNYDRLCIDYTGTSNCNLIWVDNTHERNIFEFKKTDSPLFYITVKPVGGKAGITIINEVTK